MKRVLIALLFILALSVVGQAQSNPPLRITEVDGSPAKTNATRLVFPNGTLTISGSVVTYTPAGGAGGGDALTTNPLSQFASTTSAQLASVISNETGSSLLVFNTSPTLVTPVLGVATATSINKLTITAPATSATLTIANGKTATISNTLTFTGTDSSSVAFGTGGTVLYGNQTITLSGDTSGSGTTAITTAIGATKVTSAMLNADVFSTAHSWGGVQTFTAPVLGAATGTSLILSSDLTAANHTATGQTYYINTGQTVFWKAGTGSPEGVVTGGIGSLWSRTDGTTDTAVYRKETGAGNTGWVAVAAAGTGDMVLASIQTVTGAKTFGSAGAVGKFILAGTTSGTTVVNSAAVAGSTTLTLPIAPAASNSPILVSTAGVMTYPTGTPDGTKFLRDDGAWAAASGGGLPSGLTFTSPDFTVATAAANQAVLSGSTTTNPIKLLATGSDTNISLTLGGKGTGVVQTAGDFFVGTDSYGSGATVFGANPGTSATAVFSAYRLGTNINTASPTNYERASIGFNQYIGLGNDAYLGTEKAGSGSSRGLHFVIGGTSIFKLDASGNILYTADNTQDIGAVGATRPRSLYLGGWMNWAGEAYLASNQTNSTSTLASTTLSVTLQSGKKYGFKIVLFVSDSVAGEGVKVDLAGGTATATTIRAHAIGTDTTVGTINTQVTALNTAINAATWTGAGMIVIEGAITCASGGTFIPQFAQNSHSTGTLTLAIGSSITMFDMP